MEDLTHNDDSQVDDLSWVTQDVQNEWVRHCRWRGDDDNELFEENGVRVNIGDSLEGAILATNRWHIPRRYSE